MELKSRWVKIYTGFMFVFALGAGLVAYISPETMFSMLQVNFEDVRIITNGFGARNIAIAAFALFALLSKKAFVYLSFFIMRLVVDLQDCFNQLLVISDYMNPFVAIISFVLIFFAPLILGIIQIRKEINLSKITS